MLKKVFVVLTVVLSALPLATMAQEASGAPKLVVPELIKDFRTVGQGEVLTHEFQLVNEGTALLEVKAVRPTCGCTVADFAKEIPPGETGAVTVKLDTSGFNGPISKSILVLTNSPDNPTTNLVVKADVQPFLEVLPRPLVRFNAVQGEESAQKVTLVTPNDTPFTIKKVESDMPFIRTAVRQLEATERIAGKGPSQYEVDMVLTEDAPAGPVNATVMVHTDHPEASNVGVRVFGVVRSLLHVTPSQLQFGTVDPASRPGRNVIVVNNQLDSPVRVTGAEVDDPAFTAQVLPIEEGRRYQVTVLLAPEAASGTHQGTLTIATTDAKFGELKVPVMANVQ